jgi:phosphoribosylglycinamide formyltransferase 1
MSAVSQQVVAPTTAGTHRRRVAAVPIAVLISGAGTNLRAILEQVDDGRLDARVQVVVTNRASAAGLEFARTRGIPCFVFPRQQFADRDARDTAIADCLIEHGVDLVVLAGYDQILGDAFVQRFSWRIMNLHPSLLPAFGGGMHAVRDAFEYGAKVTGCTIHFVADDFPTADSGPVILQQAVPILEDDTEETLLERVHMAEHQIFPAAIQLYAEGRLQREGRRIRILPAGTAAEPATDGTLQ